MSRFLRGLFAGAGLLAMLTLPACGPVEDTRPGRPVAHRQEAFREILRAFEPMGIQLRTESFEAEAFLRHATKLEAVKEAPWSYFGADTQYPPSQSKDRLWQEKERFEALRDAFLRAVTDLREAAQSREEGKARAAWQTVETTCRDCHKPYKY
ncbi:MAG: cytochrome c [Zoogloeaceae bacterium]|jgi:cytochrome c556|nr:cytochrome c [Zoogloeaceae bacterium]